MPPLLPSVRGRALWTQTLVPNGTHDDGWVCARMTSVRKMLCHPSPHTQRPRWSRQKRRALCRKTGHPFPLLADLLGQETHLQPKPPTRFHEAQNTQPSGTGVINRATPLCAPRVPMEPSVGPLKVPTSGFVLPAGVQAAGGWVGWRVIFLSVCSGSSTYLVESRHLSECSESGLQATPLCPPTPHPHPESGVGRGGYCPGFPESINVPRGGGRRA